MNQGKLEVVKQEMARVNADILGISKLKWTGMGGKSHGQRSLVGYSPWGRKELYTTERLHSLMGEFNSDDHYIYYCGQESLRRNGVAIMVNKRV